MRKHIDICKNKKCFDTFTMSAIYSTICIITIYRIDGIERVLAHAHMLFCGTYPRTYICMLIHAYIYTYIFLIQVNTRRNNRAAKKSLICTAKP